MSRNGSQDPRAGHHSSDNPKRDDGSQGGSQGGGGLLSRHNQQNPQSQPNQKNQQNARTPSPSTSRGRDSQRRPERAPANLPRYGGSNSGGNGAGNGAGNGGSSRSIRNDTPPPAPRQPSSSASRGRGRPGYEPYADAPWNQSWQWSDNPQTAESQTYPAADDRRGWDESQQWRAGQWDDNAQWDQGGQWGASDAWQPAAQGALDGRGVATATKGNGGKGNGGKGDGGPPQKKNWKRRLGLTRDAWQWEKLRAWPGVLRLVMAVMFAGGLIGLLTFSIRPIPIGGTPTADGSPLQGPGNGPVPTAPPSLYGGTGPNIYQPPTATPVPTRTPIPVVAELTARPLKVTTTCAQGATASTTLTNNSANPIAYSVSITKASGSPSALVTAQPASGTVPAQPGQATVTLDATAACAALTAQTYIATITWSAQANAAGTPPAKASSGTITITDNVIPPSPGSQSTVTPTPTATTTKAGSGGGTPPVP